MKFLSHNSMMPGAVAVDPRRRAAGMDEACARGLLARMLWRAFPGCASARELGLRAGPVLGLSPRHVENLAGGVHTARVTTFLKLSAIIGAEAVAEILEGRP